MFPAKRCLTLWHLFLLFLTWGALFQGYQGTFFCLLNHNCIRHAFENFKYGEKSILPVLERPLKACVVRIVEIQEQKWWGTQEILQLPLHCCWQDTSLALWRQIPLILREKSSPSLPSNTPCFTTCFLSGNQFGNIFGGLIGNSYNRKKILDIY